MYIYDCTGNNPVLRNFAMTIYEDVGGDATFRRLVDTFYTKIERDPILRPVFPSDLEPGKERQFLFLAQYFGGPARYNELHGHPRLRMRHGHVAIGRREAQAWLEAMLAAIDDVGIAEPGRSQMREYFERGALFMMNQPV